MTKTIDALKLAEEALKMYCEHGAIFKPNETLAAIREALADHIAASGKVIAEPVKQNPVAEVRVRPLRCNESAPQVDVKWVTKPTTGFLYAAPVSVEAAVLAERAACAEVCDRFAENEAGFVAEDCAAAIRSRCNK